MRPVQIDSCRIENLRGYSDATLKLMPFTVLIGENNEGKSSVIKMLEFLLRDADDDLLTGKRGLTEHEECLWLPANRENHRARRFSLKLKFDRKIHARRYLKKKETEVLLRFSVTRHNGLARLNYGLPSKNETYEDRALELLEEVRASYQLVVIPAVRDAASSRFANSLAKRVEASIAVKMKHAKQAGAPLEYRDALHVIKKMGAIVARNRESLDLTSGLPILSKMLTKSEVRLEASPTDVARWISQSLKLALSTGDHDELMVAPDQVGNGLQSVMDIALAITGERESGKRLLLIVEEPEAFLHPSAQRDLIIGLRNALDHTKDRLLLTTHSPIVVDECRYPEAVLIRNRKFYEPGDQESERRISINTSLLSVPHAESFFSNLVFLVEGPGDRAFFEALFHRMRRLKCGSLLSKVVVQETGSKTSFAPWLNLLRAYGKEGDRPIEWHCVLDGDAASGDDTGSRAVLRALRDAGISVAQTLEQEIVTFGNITCDKSTERLSAANALNPKLTPLRVGLFSIDLEWAILGSKREDSAQKWAMRVAKALAAREKTHLSVRDWENSFLSPAFPRKFILRLRRVFTEL